MLANKTSRYDIAAHAVREGGKYNSKVQIVAHELASNFLHLKQKDKDYINLHGTGEFSYHHILSSVVSVNVLIEISVSCSSIDPEGTFETPTL